MLPFTQQAALRPHPSALTFMPDGAVEKPPAMTCICQRISPACMRAACAHGPLSSSPHPHLHSNAGGPNIQCHQEHALCWMPEHVSPLNPSCATTPVERALLSRRYALPPCVIVLPAYVVTRVPDVDHSLLYAICCGLHAVVLTWSSQIRPISVVRSV